MKLLGRPTLEAFVDLAADRLQGDWVVIGGTVLPLLGVEHRTTADIDVAGPRQATQEQTLALLDIAEELGLPVEAVNQAGAFFLHRIPDFEEHLVPLRQGARATIHRPDATLFVLLKLGRLTESDLEDCLQMLEYARGAGERVDVDRLLGVVEEEAAADPSPARTARLEQIEAALSA